MKNRKHLNRSGSIFPHQIQIHTGLMILCVIYNDKNGLSSRTLLVDPLKNDPEMQGFTNQGDQGHAINPDGTFSTEKDREMTKLTPASALIEEFERDDDLADQE